MNEIIPLRLVPKLWDTLPGYNGRKFVADLVAGITVGLVALPLAMAFAISSGVTPQAGIYTAIIAGVVVSALGGSRCQIAGPTGAFMVLVAGIVSQFGVDGLLMCTAMAGAMLVVMGTTGLGTTVRFIPRSVTIGFTNGIAVIIASTEIKDFFGLKVAPIPREMVDRQFFHSEFVARIGGSGPRCRLCQHGGHSYCGSHAFDRFIFAAGHKKNSRLNLSPAINHGRLHLLWNTGGDDRQHVRRNSVRFP